MKAKRLDFDDASGNVEKKDVNSGGLREHSYFKRLWLTSIPLPDILGKNRRAGDASQMNQGISHLLADEYSEKARAYASYWAPVIAPMALPLLEALSHSDARQVLDMGCGTGELLPHLRNTFPKAEILGVDYSEGMLRIARQYSDCRFAVMDGARLAIRDCAIDTAVSAFVLFHIPDIHAGLTELRRVLRPRGVAGIVTWGKCPEQPGVQFWKEELNANGAGPDPRDPSVMQQPRMDTLEKLSALLSKAGFMPERLWAQSFAHQWTLEGLLLNQLGCGMPARRMGLLSKADQAACQTRVEARLRTLERADLIYRPEVLYAVARV
jgi:ubiquinone/menaquinone biosynthesis C-methylase UbiE